MLKAPRRLGFALAAMFAVGVASAEPLFPASSSPATATPGNKEQLTIQELFEKSDRSIEDVIRLPIGNLAAVSDNEGTIMFVADSGRYAITGSLIDLWEGKILTSMAEIKESVNKMDVRGSGIDIDELNTISLGHGPKEIIIFVDPVCPTCTTLIADAQKLVDKYTFKLVVVPAFGENSNVLAQRLFCAANPQQRLQALITGSAASLAVRPNCDLGKYEQTLMLAHLLSIDGVPFIISEVDRHFRGRPANLEKWLQN